MTSNSSFLTTLRPRTVVRPIVLATIALALVMSGPVAAKKKRSIDPATYQDAAPEAAAAALLDLAATAARNDSWENIGVARIHLLAGRKAEAEIIFGRFDSDPGDLIRIGRAYLEADNWDTAESYFDRVLAAAPNDEDWLAEIGAYYNLQGDRAKAEELFARSFSIEPGSIWNLAKAAASYEGIAIPK